MTYAPNTKESLRSRSNVLRRPRLGHQLGRKIGQWNPYILSMCIKTTAFWIYQELQLLLYETKQRIHTRAFIQKIIVYLLFFSWFRASCSFRLSAALIGSKTNKNTYGKLCRCTNLFYSRRSGFFSLPFFQYNKFWSPAKVSSRFPRCFTRVLNLLTGLREPMNTGSLSILYSYSCWCKNKYISLPLHWQLS